MKLYRAYIKYDKAVGHEETIGIYNSFEKAKTAVEFANESRDKTPLIMEYKKVKGEFEVKGIWLLKETWEFEGHYEDELEKIYGH